MTKILKTKPTIIFFSNPFGYGPTTTLIHLAEVISKLTDIQMVVAGKNDGLCKEVFSKSNHSNMQWHDLDERNFDQVKEYISQFKKPYIVSILNRFSIEASRQLGVHNALIDFLAWFWDKPAREYSLSEYYFYNSLGAKVTIPTSNAYDVPIILGSIPKKSKSQAGSQVLINIGGSQNPMVEGLPYEYLKLLVSIIDKIEFPKKSKVYIGGGKLATEYIKENLSHPERFIIGSFDHEEFLQIHANSDHVISLSGTNATFMSFKLGIPTTFLLPQLLAHWKLSIILRDQKISDPLMWEDYFDVDDNIYKLTEYDVVPYTENLSIKLRENPELLSKVVNKIQSQLETNLFVKKQTEYINKLGVNGEKFVAELLVKKWNLPKNK